MAHAESGIWLKKSVSPFSFGLKFRLQVWWVVERFIFRLIPHKLNRLRITLLKMFGAKIGKGCFVHPRATIYMPWNLVMGDFSSIDFDSIIYNIDKVFIGSYVSIAYGCNINTASHDYTDPCFGLIMKQIIISSGVFLGTQAYVSPGVTIGKMAVVGARSVVTKDIPENYICFGSPAKTYKLRIGRL
jgi:putative colanic acid biosynthesis acetyltransferase WcaF